MRYRFAGVADESAVLQRLVAQLQANRVAAIIGPHGTGKTTLLQHLVDPLQYHFGAIGSVRLSSACRPPGIHKLNQWIRSVLMFEEAQPTSAEIGPATGSSGERLLVIDGFEQLSLLARAYLVLRIKRTVTATPVRLLITAHRDLRGIPTVFRTRWDDQIVKALTAEKLSGLPSGLRAEMSLIATRLAAETQGTGPTGRPHSGNVRDYWFSLYDAYETLRAKMASGLSHDTTAERR